MWEQWSTIFLVTSICSHTKVIASKVWMKSALVCSHTLQVATRRKIPQYLMRAIEISPPMINLIRRGAVPRSCGQLLIAGLWERVQVRVKVSWKCCPVREREIEMWSCTGVLSNAEEERLKERGVSARGCGEGGWRRVEGNGPRHDVPQPHLLLRPTLRARARMPTLFSPSCSVFLTLPISTVQFHVPSPSYSNS